MKLGGICEKIEKQIQDWLPKNIDKPYPEFKFEARSVRLGHLQRGGSPTAFDRVLGTRLGVQAIELIKQGKWGHMVSLKGTEIKAVKLEEAVKGYKLVPPERLEEAKIFEGI